MAEPNPSVATTAAPTDVTATASLKNVRSGLRNGSDFDIVRYNFDFSYSQRNAIPNEASEYRRSGALAIEQDDRQNAELALT
jgi:hypothetical protein